LDVDEEEHEAIEQLEKSTRNVPTLNQEAPKMAISIEDFNSTFA